MRFVKMKSQTSSLQLWLPLFILIYCRIIEGSDRHVASNEEDKSKKYNLDDPKSSLNRTIDAVMIPLYDATNYFIETALAPKSLSALNSTYDLANWNQKGDFFYSNWTAWMDHYLTYVMCMMCAGIYVLGLITSALCICCCRMRGRCGSFDGMDDKHSKCKRRTCCFLLLFITICLLMGACASFIANHLTWELTDSKGMGTSFQRSLVSAKTYQNITSSDYATLYKSMNVTYHSLQKELEVIPSQGYFYFEETYNVSESLQQLEYNSEEIEQIVEPLGNAANITAQIVDLEADFEKDLELVQNNFVSDLMFCTDVNCSYVLNKSSTIGVQSNYSSLASLPQAAQAFQDILTGNESIFVHINSSKNAYSSLPDKINSIIIDDVESLHDFTQAMYNELSALMDYMIHDVIDKYDLDSPLDSLEESIIPEIEEKGDIRFFCCLTMCILLLVLIICSFVAISFGVCGTRPQKHNAGCCHKGKAARTLQIILIFVFISGVIFMCAITYFFIIGAITHDVCRPAVDPDSSKDNVQALDYILSSHTGMKQSFADMIVGCAANTTIYNALGISGLGSKFNISAILDLKAYIFGALNNISIANYSIEIILISVELESDLNIIDTTFTEMDLSSYQSEISTPVTNINIEEFAQELEDFGTFYNETNQTLSDIFFEYASEFNSLYSTYVTEIESLSESLQIELDPVIELESNFNVSAASTDLTNAESDINNGHNLQSVMAEIAANLTEEYNVSTATAEKMVLSNLGQCAPLYEAYTLSATAFCIHFLYPFNAFWFSIGWCLMWYLPLIWVGFCLIDQYNKTEAYNDLFSKTGRASFHRTRHSGRKSGKSSRQFMDSVQLDHNPGCTDDDDDIAMYRLPDNATTTFHGNDAFGYQGRTVDEDALEYFGRSNLRSVARQRGLRDGTLPPETYGLNASVTSTTQHQQQQQQHQTVQQVQQQHAQPVQIGPSRQQQYYGADIAIAAAATPRHSHISDDSTTNSGNSKQAKDSSSDDEESVTKSSLEQASHNDTYPFHQHNQPQFDLSTSSVASRSRTSGYEPEPMVYTGASKRSAIPIPFIEGVANPAFANDVDPNDNVDADNYVHHLRRTSRRMSKERPKKHYSQDGGAIPKTKQYSSYGSQGVNIDGNSINQFKNSQNNTVEPLGYQVPLRSYAQPENTTSQQNQHPQNIYNESQKMISGISNPAFQQPASPTYVNASSPPVSQMAFSPAKNFQLPLSPNQRLNYSSTPIDQLPKAAVKPSFATASPTENSNYDFLRSNQNSAPVKNPLDTIDVNHNRQRHSDKVSFPPSSSAAAASLNAYNPVSYSSSNNEHRNAGSGSLMTSSPVSMDQPSPFSYTSQIQPSWASSACYNNNNEETMAAHRTTPKETHTQDILSKGNYYNNPSGPKEVNYFAHSPVPQRAHGVISSNSSNSAAAGVSGGIKPFTYIPSGVKRDHQRSPMNAVVRGADYVRHNSMSGSGNESQEYIHAAYF